MKINGKTVSVPEASLTLLERLADGWTLDSFNNHETIISKKGEIIRFSGDSKDIYFISQTFKTVSDEFPINQEPMASAITANDPYISLDARYGWLIVESMLKVVILPSIGIKKHLTVGMDREYLFAVVKLSYIDDIDKIVGVLQQDYAMNHNLN